MGKIINSILDNSATKISSSATSVRPYCFYDNTNLVEFHDERLQSVGGYAFYRTHLTNLYFPNCTFVDGRAFSLNASSDTPTILTARFKSPLALDDSAFLHQSNLKYLTCEDHRYIGEFDDKPIPNEQGKVTNKDNETYTLSVGDVIFVGDTYECYKWNGTKWESYRPTTTVSLGQHVFSDSGTLRSNIKFLDAQIDSMSSRAMMQTDCPRIYIKDGTSLAVDGFTKSNVYYIDGQIGKTGKVSAIYDCPNLREVVFADDFNSISSSWLGKCYSLYKMTFNYPSVVSIGTSMSDTKIGKYLGNSDTQIYNGSTTSTIYINGDSGTPVTPDSGAIVTYNDNDYIWDGTTWTIDISGNHPRIVVPDNLKTAYATDTTQGWQLLPSQSCIFVSETEEEQDEPTNYRLIHTGPFGPFGPMPEQASPQNPIDFSNDSVMEIEDFVVTADNSCTLTRYADDVVLDTIQCSSGKTLIPNLLLRGRHIKYSISWTGTITVGWDWFAKYLDDGWYARGGELNSVSSPNYRDIQITEDGTKEVRDFIINTDLACTVKRYMDDELLDTINCSVGQTSIPDLQIDGEDVYYKIEWTGSITCDWSYTVNNI